MFKIRTSQGTPVLLLVTVSGPCQVPISPRKVDLHGKITLFTATHDGDWTNWLSRILKKEVLPPRPVYTSFYATFISQICMFLVGIILVLLTTKILEQICVNHEILYNSSPIKKPRCRWEQFWYFSDTREQLIMSLVSMIFVMLSIQTNTDSDNV